ncbi:MAG: hypothetical protein KatS3mg104_3164 [Phycisphaerae bacterium]|jgi:6-pyruvoyltetrahydropterin/6-carboxytetrahydropterin synthase|nr:MAG: hypothetical protein KatS3mg104_3164 [Phycisphaerae bacterium]
MMLLTREVRFTLKADRMSGELEVPVTGHNGHGGIPAYDPGGCFFVLRITLAGSVDPVSSYLRSITDIDREVRDKAIPFLQNLWFEGRCDPATVLKGLKDRLSESWRGSSLEKIEWILTPYHSVEWISSEPQMIRVSQKFEFSAAHRLHNPSLSDEENRRLFGKCNNPYGHGHNYELEVTLAGDPDTTGVLMPLSILEKIVHQQVIDPLDHKFLNLEVEAFKTCNPSVENIARVIFGWLQSPLKQPNCRLDRVTVWETPKTWATYSE